ncbi:MAG: PilZ domain-containing protein [Deltaproteobacteria bacterium]|nr:PilZ domain-containing protein [Deltaproteobacteria bacterium]
MTGEDRQQEGDDRRASERIPVEMWVEESNDRELYFQRGGNISVGGIYLKHTVPHPLGTKVALRFTLPGDSSAIEVKGEIVNIAEEESELGMGVKFVQISDENRRRIEAFIGDGSEG